MAQFYGCWLRGRLGCNFSAADVQSSAFQYRVRRMFESTHGSELEIISNINLFEMITIIGLS